MPVAAESLSFSRSPYTALFGYPVAFPSKFGATGLHIAMFSEIWPLACLSSAEARALKELPRFIIVESLVSCRTPPIEARFGAFLQIFWTGENFSPQMC